MCVAEMFSDNKQAIGKIHSHPQSVSTRCTGPCPGFPKPFSLNVAKKPLKRLTETLASRQITCLKPYVNARPRMIFLFIGVLLLLGCGAKKIEPAPIEANDICSFCKMAISETRYAAEFIDNDGQAFKFDDIGCMTNFIKQKRANNGMQARFVMDYEGREWIKAESAFYVRSSEFNTPMNGGIVAFKDQERARAAAAKYHGALTRYDDILK